MTLDVIKILIPAVLAFFVGIGITPTITNYLYKHKMWKTSSKGVGLGGYATPVFDEKLDKEKITKTPRLGGVVIWLSALIVGIIFWLLGRLIDIEIFAKLEFISRNQTWIPFATLLFGAVVGAIDDIMTIKGGRDNKAGGLSAKKRLLFVGLVGFLISLWFYTKLDVSSIFLPFIGYLNIGWLFIPFFILTMMFMYAGGVIDGIDGLSGGIFAVSFGAYAVIAYSNSQVDLAAFCALIVGAILAFLWFNIPPARFYMSETGSMALTITLSTVALMTDELGGGKGLFVLPLVAFPLVMTVLTVILQQIYKRMTGGKKIFLSTPIHHHFEAIGWPSYKVTMRYWIISIVFATIGVIYALVV